ncbi:hypothetical protein ACOZ38_44365 [Sphaerisporangium viridialbum]|uniref:hypothetical protein n=1 Tax=Sphaerisporangium viridialbum TaxID=46189 RepID=UPI003C786246
MDMPSLAKEYVKAVRHDVVEEADKILADAAKHVIIVVGKFATSLPGGKGSTFRLQPQDQSHLCDSADEAANAARMEILESGHEAALMALANTVEHTRALRLDLRRSAGHDWTFVTLARAALEGAAVCAYLLDVGIPPQQRLTRMAAIYLRGMLESARYDQSFGQLIGAMSLGEDPPQDMLDRQQQAVSTLADRASRAVDSAISRYETAGMSVNAARSAVVLDGHVSPVRVRTTRLVADLMAKFGGGIHYQIPSGIAHSQPWAIADSWYAGARPRGLIDPVTTTAMALAALIDRIAKYYEEEEPIGYLVASVVNFVLRVDAWETAMAEWEGNNYSGSLPGWESIGKDQPETADQS